MTAVAEELDRRLQTLEPEKAARCEQLIRDVLALLKDDLPPATASECKQPFLLSHSFGLKPGIDPTKLGQLVDDL